MKKLLFLALFLGLAITPVYSHAQTVPVSAEELRTQLDALTQQLILMLQQQIAELVKQIQQIQATQATQQTAQANTETKITQLASVVHTDPKYSKDKDVPQFVQTLSSVKHNSQNEIMIYSGKEGICVDLTEGFYISKPDFVKITFTKLGHSSDSYSKTCAVYGETPFIDGDGLVMKAMGDSITKSSDVIYLNRLDAKSLVGQKLGLGGFPLSVTYVME